MPFYDVRCLTCGQEATDVLAGVSEVAACASCGLPTERIWRSKAANVNGDECDIWQENGFRDPQHFTSKNALKNALAKKGLEIRASNAGPHDKICGRWATMDAYTLKAAQILVARQGEPTQ